MVDEAARFREFCALLTLDNGRPFTLEPFQETMLGDYFAGTTETVALLGKKLGKSTLLAAVALFTICDRADAEVVVAAASRDQAMLIFQSARGFVRRSDDLGQLVAVHGGMREIRSTRRGGRVRVIASDVETADGWLGDLAIVDEYHRHRTSDLYGVLRDGLGPRGGRLLCVTTAGEDEDTPLGRLRASALALPFIQRADGHTHARSEDGSFAFHEWALQPGEDVHDMDVVKRANPASWWTPEALQRRHDSPSMTAAQWLRFACGIWTLTEAQWVTPEEWDACAGQVSSDRDADWHVGVDVGRKRDSTAVVAAAMIDDRLHVRAKVLLPTPGRPVAVADARAEITRMHSDLRVREVVYDPHQFQESAEILEEQGLVMVEMPQSDSRMAPAAQTLHELIRAGRLVHDGSPELRSQLLSAVPSETERGQRISKRKSRQRIDAAIALAMAADRAVKNLHSEEPAFIFEVFS
jgi:phage terminase large subunit-like protein